MPRRQLFLVTLKSVPLFLGNIELRKISKQNIKFYLPVKCLGWFCSEIFNNTTEEGRFLLRNQSLHWNAK